jgi:hypothetical protein
MMAMVGPVGADTQATKELMSAAERIKRFIADPFLLNYLMNISD